MKLSDKESAQKTILYAESIIKDAGDDAPMIALCVLAYVMNSKNVRMDDGRLEKAVYAFPGVEAVYAAATKGGDNESI